MTIIVEDGSIVDGANSFASLAYFSTYLSERGWPAIDDATAEPLLKRSYDFMRFLPWCESHEIEFTFTDNLPLGQCEIARNISNGWNPSELQEQAIKREKVGPIDTEYFGPSPKSQNGMLKQLPQAHGFLKGLLCAKGGRVLRA